jgi:hypothetical protein
VDFSGVFICPLFYAKSQFLIVFLYKSISDQYLRFPKSKNGKAGPDARTSHGRDAQRMAINQRAGHFARMNGCTVAPGPPSPCLPQCGMATSLPAWNHPGPCIPIAAGFFHPKQGDFMQQRPKTSLMTPLALALCAAALATPALAQQDKVRIGFITDLSCLSADVEG